MKWYEIRAKAKDTTEILIYGDIGESWWSESVTASQFVKDLQAVETPNVTVRINSFGGSVPDGLAIYNALRRFSGDVTVEIDGVALSIASLIAMAGTKVRMAENAQFMVHAPWAFAMGNAAELREQADLLDRFADAMVSSYSRRPGVDEGSVRDMLKDGEDHWFSAQEAIDAGFVDEMSETVEVDASARFDSKRFRSVPAAAAAFMMATEKEKPMDPKKKAATESAETASQGANTQAAAQELPAAAATVHVRSAAETQEIRAMFAAFKDRAGVTDILVDVLADTSVAPAAASKRLLDHLGKDTEPARAQGYLATLSDETDKRREAVVHALMARSGQQVDAKHLQGNPYRGHTLLDLARASLERIGFDARGMTKMEIVGAAFTQGTSDFPILLENTMHKALLGAYALTPDTWRKFCAVGSVSDFRAHNRYRTGSFGNLDQVNELGEFTNKSIPDGEKSTVSAVTKGNLINISRQAVINDDLGAFVGLAGMLGRAAARSVEADVYALLALNSNAGPSLGGTTLWHSTRNNLAGSAAAPTMALIDTGRVAMASQKDISGNDYLDLRPSIVLCSMGIGGTMRTINEAQYDPDTANKLQKPNMVRGLFREVIDTPRLTGNAWIMFADPAVAPTLEVVFLDGNQQPYLELQNGFEVDGARYKVRLDYGVAGVDWRPTYRSPAA